MHQSMSSPIALTENAAHKINELIVKQENDQLSLRVYIQGGGCSGFQYGFEFVEGANDDDAVIEKDGVKVLVDPLSYQYLIGAQVDYKEDLMGSRFIVSNPNATTTCGCGASFSM